MLPTLNGRIQTRIVLLAVIGGLVTLIITPVLPLPAGTTLSNAYRDTFIILAAVIVLGALWECLYHVIMQWRWEKDWPTFFGFITIINEGALVWVLLHFKALPGIVGTVPTAAFIIDFVLVWMAVWLWANGPARVVNIRWRFHGGRFV